VKEKFWYGKKISFFIDFFPPSDLIVKFILIFVIVGRNGVDAWNKIKKLEHTARVILAAWLLGPMAQEF
jgi:hypothetical protein